MSIISNYHPVAYGTQGNTPYTFYYDFQINVSKRLDRVGLFFTSPGTYSAEVGIFRNSDGIRVGTVPLQSVTASSADLNTGVVWVNLTTPVVLSAATNYRIAIHQTANIYFRNDQPGAHDETTVDGIILTSYIGSASYSNGNTASSFSPGAGTYAYEGRWNVDLVNPNTAPTATITSPETAVARDPRNTMAFSWTYSDPEANAQNAYQLQHRVRGSTGAWTTVTGTTATTHTFAANTFTLGVEYEWQVRVSDAIAGYGNWTALRWFMAGVDVWDYSATITSTATSGSIPNLHYTNDFEATNSLTVPIVWESNNFFGTYTAATFARSTVRARSGTNSMEVTWPTGAESRVNLQSIGGFEVGGFYVYKASVWVPTGTPSVTVDPFLQEDAAGSTISLKDQWVDLAVGFRAATTGINFAIKIAGSTSGQKTWVDNVSVTQVSPSLEPGTYIFQVKTTDNFGAVSPWSSSGEFVQQQASNVYVRVGGVWVLKTTQTKVAGVFKNTNIKKVRQGGAWVP